jgi:ABC-2 type transport system permease protein
MLDTLQLYGAYIRLYFKAQREYRTNFLAGVAANFYTYFFTYSPFWVLTQKFSSLGGWKFNEIAILYSLNLLTYAVAGTIFWYSVYFLEEKVISGDLDRYLVRPRGVLVQLVCQQFGYTFLGQIFVVLIFMLSSLTQVAARLNWAKGIYLLAAIVAGVLIQSGGVILTGALSFWITRSRDVGQILYYNLREFVNYPLNMFPAFVKTILTFVLPWAFINYYPAVILLDKANGQLDVVLGVLAPLLSVGFFVLSLWVFERGLRRYTGAGH